jgi:hypothetical protein
MNPKDRAFAVVMCRAKSATPAGGYTANAYFFGETLVDAMSKGEKSAVNFRVSYPSNEYKVVGGMISHEVAPPPDPVIDILPINRMDNLSKSGSF